MIKDLYACPKANCRDPIDLHLDAALRCLVQPMAMSHERFYLLRCCPACRSLDVRRSHRRGLFEVLILPLFLLRPFRCEDCTKRHYNLFFTRALHEPEHASRGSARAARESFPEARQGDEAKF